MSKARDLANLGTNTAALATDSEVALKVSKSGDTMTGTLNTTSVQADSVSLSYGSLTLYNVLGESAEPVISSPNSFLTIAAPNGLIVQSNSDTTLPKTRVTSYTAGQSGVRNITVSTSDPSGGADGDVWIKYTA